MSIFDVIKVRRDEIMKVLSAVKYEGIVVTGSAPRPCYCLPCLLLKSPGYNIVTAWLGDCHTGLQVQVTSQKIISTNKTL